MKRALVLAAVILSACAGTPIGDAMTGKEKLAEQDSAYCKSIGAVEGTDAYMQCRLFRTAERERNHQAAYQRAGAGIANASQSYGNSLQQTAVRTPTNCRSVRAVDGSIQTSCY